LNEKEKKIMRKIRRVFSAILILSNLAFTALAQETMSDAGKELILKEARALGMGAVLSDPGKPDARQTQHGVWYMCFETGCVYLFGDGTQSKVVHAVRSVIYYDWQHSKGIDGSLGYPTSNENYCVGTPNPEDSYQNFEGGRIYWNARGGSATIYNNNAKDFPCRLSPGTVTARPVGEPVEAKPVDSKNPVGNPPEAPAAITVDKQNQMINLAGKYNLGRPREDSRASANQTQSGALKKLKGWFLCYERGCVYYQESLGVWVVTGTIMLKWGESQWERGNLGFPISAVKHCEGSSDTRDRYQEFEGGRIYWKSATDTAIIYASKDPAFPCRSQPNPIATPTGSALRVSGEAYGITTNAPTAITVTKQTEMEALARNYNLGSARADTANGAKTTYSGYDKGGGWFLCFERGCVYYSQTAGTHAVYGTILQKWNNLGYEQGSFGFPTTEELSCGGTGDSRDRYQRFEGGIIYWRAANDMAIAFGKSNSGNDSQEFPCR
jgi:uncharacterized protein with LGFP repeats